MTRQGTNNTGINIALREINELLTLSEIRRVQYALDKLALHIVVSVYKYLVYI